MAAWLKALPLLAWACSMQYHDSAEPFAIADLIVFTCSHPPFFAPLLVFHLFLLMIDSH